MNKIWLIIQREYLTRVKKKSFIIMTILGPLLMAAVMILPIYLSQQSDKVYNLLVVDETGLFKEKIRENRSLKFVYLDQPIAEVRDMVSNGYYDGVLYIMQEGVAKVNAPIFFENQIGISNIEYIRSELQNILDEVQLMAEFGISKQELETRKVKVDVGLIDNQTDSIGNPLELSILSMAGGLIIYFFIFMFGAQVMRGVIEEKTNRIVEVIISSVRPFQLMMGKIIGVAMVGLTQFLLWIIFTTAIVGIVAVAFPESFTPDNLVQQQFTAPGTGLVPGENLAINQDINPFIESLYSLLDRLPVVNILLSFVFYFLFGYLMYSALFAAIGSAVDNEADTQQFMLPVTIPMVLGIVMSSFIMNNPQGPVAFWFSMIPLTSPITMMMRIPFGVPIWEQMLSMAILILTFLATTWLAAKIYRTGILMYGKKPTYKELWKWIRHSG
ncbi:MAG: ABC transporter permease [Bacteroidales bacterium]